jgi:hypothetical protein
MSKVILSTDLNEEYLFFTPITAFCWNYFGFTPIIYIIINDKIKSRNLGLVIKILNTLKINCKIFIVQNNSNFKDCTIAQTIRLFGWENENENDYIVLGDIDMIPLNSFLNRDFDKLNVFGYDLTDRTQIPMCYVGMKKKFWENVIHSEKDKSEYENVLISLSKISSNSNSDDFEKYWYCDQIILTDSIKSFGENNFNFIDRGKMNNGYAVKRVDRGNWNWDKNEEYMDSHLLRNPQKNFSQIYDLIDNYFKKDCSWMKEYYSEFYK